MVTVSSCQLLATSIIVVRTIQVSQASTGQVRSALVTQMVRYVCALMALVPVTWAGTSTLAAMDDPCDQSALRIYSLLPTNNK
jgi:spore maturation protein SpmA